MKCVKGRLSACVAFVLMGAIAGAQGGISVTIDGQPVQFQGTGPQMINGRVLVPLRGVFEKLGAYVQWNSDQHSVYASRGQDTVQLQIGNTNATVDGRNVALDVPAQIVDGSTMVPIRFVSESIGAQVGWQDATQTVVISSGGGAPNPAPNPEPDQQSAAQDDANGGSGPVRMARFSWIQGGVTWRPGEDVDWSPAAFNLPIRQGAEIWLDPGAMADVQFDDGSVVHLGGSAIATLQTMFSDSSGEFTEIRLNTGTATMRLTNQYSTFQVDTPLASVTSTGSSNIRISDISGLRVIAHSGQATVEGPGGQTTVDEGGFLSLNNANSPFNIRQAPGDDSWDRYCQQRDNGFFQPSPHLPPNIGLVAGNLDAYGSWVQTANYGYCWRPNESDPNWAPYRDGHWVWVSPFGWTWCGNEQWGWAPYHYGTWQRSDQGWVWAPGPSQQYWSPAVVHFSSYNGQVAWCALAPGEVHYPAAISVGFRSGNWALSFSIGGAATYQPAGGGYCAPRPWNNRVVNRTTNVYNVTNITNIRNVTVVNNFVPRNAGVAGGATVASTSGFASGHGFAHGGGQASTIFSRGRMAAAGPGGSPGFAGPVVVKPTAASFTPSHSFSRAKPNPELLSRPVVRAPLPPAIRSTTRPMQGVRTLPTRTAPVTTAPVSNPGVTRPSNPRFPRSNDGSITGRPTNPRLPRQPANNTPTIPKNNPRTHNPRQRTPNQGGSGQYVPNQGNPRVQQNRFNPGPGRRPLPTRVQPNRFGQQPNSQPTRVQPNRFGQQPNTQTPKTTNPRAKVNPPPKQPSNQGNNNNRQKKKKDHSGGN